MCCMKLIVFHIHSRLQQTICGMLLCTVYQNLVAGAVAIQRMLFVKQNHTWDTYCDVDVNRFILIRVTGELDRQLYTLFQHMMASWHGNVFRITGSLRGSAMRSFVVTLLLSQKAVFLNHSHPSTHAHPFHSALSLPLFPLSLISLSIPLLSPHFSSLHLRGLLNGVIPASPVFVSNNRYKNCGFIQLQNMS